MLQLSGVREGATTAVQAHLKGYCSIDRGYETAAVAAAQDGLRVRLATAKLVCADDHARSSMDTIVVISFRDVCSFALPGAPVAGNMWSVNAICCKSGRVVQKRLLAAIPNKGHGSAAIYDRISSRIKLLHLSNAEDIRWHPILPLSMRCRCARC